MKNNKQIYTFIAILVLVFGGIVGARIWGSTQPGAYDELAQHLTNTGVKFYGAFWCPHCQAQKALFGNSVKLLPYVECSTADKKGQTQVCIDAGIKSYPTWEFADGTRAEGELTLEQLAERTGFDLETKTAKAVTDVPLDATMLSGEVPAEASSSPENFIAQ